MAAMTDPVKSMTGFARAQLPVAGGELVCELRSVNHRYLEMAVRLPAGLGALESVVRARLAAGLARGKIDCHVSWNAAPVGMGLTWDRGLVAELVRIDAEIRATHARHEPPLGPVRVADILAWPGAVVAAGPPDLEDAVLAVCVQALTALLAHRGREGARLAEVLREKLDCMAAVLPTLRAAAGTAATTAVERLRARIAASGVEADPARLTQELVSWAQRGDIEEEIDRLGVHIAEARAVLAGKGPVGRRLDFLLQELNREANTAGAKVITAAQASMAVDLKVLIEHMREQVQNVE